MAVGSCAFATWWRGHVTRAQRIDIGFGLTILRSFVSSVLTCVWKTLCSFSLDMDDETCPSGRFQLLQVSLRLLLSALNSIAWAALNT